MKFLNLLKYCWVLALTPLIIQCGSDEDPVADPATLSISANATTAAEDQGTIPVTFSLSRASEVDVTISLSFGGTATRESDYMFPPTVTIDAGSTSASVNLGITDDTDVEETETIEISVSALGLPESVTLGSTTSVSVLITDNDTDTGGGGGGDCPNDNSTNTNNFECTTTAPVSSEFSASVSGDVRSITTNGVPDHDYRIQIPDIVSTIDSSTKNYSMDATPTVASSTTDIANNGRPQWAFGVALNGVKIDPAPAEPFIFETPAGEYVWEWIFEPNANMEAVGLDCAVAHFQPDGQYHYHGDMAIYADQLLDGLGAGTTTPTEAVQIGWAADGFPIVYKFGPNPNGNLTELAPSYRVKNGERPGDGESAPCGEYNGKYTADYEYVEGLGDLDECNGIARSITLGGETFNYFYVITADFPVISRCFTGEPNDSFMLGGG